MLRIDTHSHWTSPSYVESIREHSSASRRFRQVNAALLGHIDQADSKMRRLDARLEEMDLAAIDISVLSLPPPAATFGDPALRRRVARDANDEFLAAAKQHPGRFAVFLALPWPDADEALAELERVRAHTAARGVQVLTTSERWTVDDRKLERVFARVADLELPVMAHPAKDPLPGAWEDWALGSSLAPIVSSSLGVARLVLSGMLDRLPKLEVIVPHLGGALPYLAQRLVDFGSGAARHDFTFYLRERLFYDTCSFHTPAFRCCVETAGVNRLVLGSDYPARGSLSRLIDDVIAAVPDEGEREMVFGATASRWFDTPDRRRSIAPKPS